VKDYKRPKDDAAHIPTTASIPNDTGGDEADDDDFMLQTRL